MSDSQDRAEALDDDKLADTSTTPVEDLEYPPDEPMGVDAYGTTAAEERWDEPIDERVGREEPEDGPIGDGMRLVDPDEGAAGDDEPDAVATAEDASDLSAEEAAIHLTESPPMGDGDGYLDGEDEER